MSFSSSETAKIRAQLPATARCAYLNTGTCGPLPSVAANAMAEASQNETVHGRADTEGYQLLATQVAGLRAQLAKVIGALGSEIAFTHNTTEGVNIVLAGFPWRVGRIVTTTLEHSGTLVPLYQARRRHGIEVSFADIGDGAADRTLDVVSQALRSEADLLVLSHVCYGTGAVLPIGELVKLAHGAGCRVLVDGAQAVGAIAVDVAELGVDYYAFPGQKWLCGPEGTGGLFVRSDLVENLEPTMPGSFSVDLDAYRQNDPVSLVFLPSAARFESASVYRPAVAGLSAAVAWLEHLGWGEIYSTISDRTSYALSRIDELSGVTSSTPADAHAGLVAFDLEGVDSVACVGRLLGTGVAVRRIPDSGALRLSCGFFTTEEDVDRALDLIHTCVIESAVGAP